MYGLMRAIYLGNGSEGYQTGVSAYCETQSEWMALCANGACDIKDAEFMIDLVDVLNGDILDTCPISAAYYERLTGQPVMNLDYYQQQDEIYWGNV